MRPVAHVVHAMLLGALAATPMFAQAQAAPPASRNAAAVQRFDIPASPLAAAISRFAAVAGVGISFESAQLQGLQSPGLQGTFTVDQGFAQLLRGSGWEAEHRGGGTYALRKAPPQRPAEAGPSATPSSPMLPVVTVTASAAGADGPPPSYAGGQVARGGRAGLLGDKDFMDTPFNITSYTAQTIADQQARTIVEILENDPSVLTTTSRLNGMDQFNVRGYSVNNSASSFGGLYGVGPYYRGSLMGIERVEVLKGPSALLNGMSPTGSIGGNINLVPKRAGDEALTQLTTSYQSDSLFGGHLDLARRFGPDQSLGVRFNAGYKDGNGGYDGQSQSLGEATLGLDYRGDGVRLALDAGYLNSKVDGTEGVMSIAAGSGVPAAPDARTNYFQRWNYWNTEATYGAVRAEWDVAPNLTAFAAAGARSASEEMLFPYGVNLTSAGNFTEVSSAQNGRWNNSTAEVGLRGRLETGSVKHQVSLTASTFREELKFGYIAGPSIASNIYVPNLVASPGLSLPAAVKTSDTTLSGVALADTLSLAEDRVQLTLGLRHQQVEKENYNTLTGATTTRYDRSAVTPALGLVVKPWQGVSLYANYIEALTQGPTAPTAASNAGEVFAPYKSKQSEAGVKFDFGKLATTVSVFQIKQPNGLTDPLTRVYALDGEQRNRGVELNTFGEIDKGVRLLGGVMFLDSELTKTANGTNDGKTSTASPRVALRLGGEWDTPFVPGLTLTTRALYTSSQYVDNANTLQIPSWTRLDVGARYRTQLGSLPTTLRASVENVADRAYWLSSNLYRGAPRTFLLSATFDF